MNYRNRNTFDVVEKFRKFRSIFDKIFITIFGSLWIFATLWDIYKLQRYWLDFAIEFYTSFFIFYMMIYFSFPYINYVVLLVFELSLFHFPS